MRTLFLSILCLLIPAYTTITQTQKMFFEQMGYLGPLPFISPTEAEAIAQEIAPLLKNSKLKNPYAELDKKQLHQLQKLINNDRNTPQGTACFWSKSAHLVVPKIASIGTSDTILSTIKQILGPDILLWGAKLVKKEPLGITRWHTDIEHYLHQGLTIWLPLTGVSTRNTLQLIPGSHKFEKIPQSFKDEIDLNDDQAVLTLAQQYDSKAKIVTFDIKPGQFIIFADKMWHNAINQTQNTRQALIFQYCRPDTRVRIPLSFNFPLLWAPDQPWVMLVSGQDHYGLNYLHTP